MQVDVGVFACFGSNTQNQGVGHEAQLAHTLDAHLRVAGEVEQTRERVVFELVRAIVCAIDLLLEVVVDHQVCRVLTIPSA